MDHKELFIRNVPGSLEILQKACVGIAGCGGLGSNAAVCLARSGVGKLILADFDKVEMSNLNRQHFFLQDLGKNKVDALAAHLKNINPQIILNIHNKKLNPEDIPVIFAGIDILLEAFDRAEAKKWLVETWCKTHRDIPVICASGLSGYGKSEAIKITKAGNIYMIGDQATDMSIGLCGARVALAASMQANTAVELLMERGKNDNS